ncbi:MAG: large subunit ribosomal protein L6 [Saprospiraceae bacterium]|jgi:large subunit ribosomal protein L6
MSRIGKAPVSILEGVTVSIGNGNVVTVKGPKGELSEKINSELTVTQEDGVISISRPTEQKRHKSLHGLSRSLISNMIEGVSSGYTRELELIGVGYRVANTGNLLELTLGYSHPIYFMVPSEVILTTAMVKGKSPYIKLEAIDKQLVGQIAAKIRAFRKPEPYKGKGVRFLGEVIRRKAGKTAAK